MVDKIARANMKLYRSRMKLRKIRFESMIKPKLHRIRVRKLAKHGSMYANPMYAVHARRLGAPAAVRIVERAALRRGMQVRGRRTQRARHYRVLRQIGRAKRLPKSIEARIAKYLP